MKSEEVSGTRIDTVKTKDFNMHNFQQQHLPNWNYVGTETQGEGRNARKVQEFVIQNEDSQYRLRFTSTGNSGLIVLDNNGLVESFFRGINQVEINNESKTITFVSKKGRVTISKGGLMHYIQTNDVIARIRVGKPQE